MENVRTVHGKIKFKGSFLGYISKFILNIPLFIITFGAWYFYWNNRYFTSHLEIEFDLEDNTNELANKLAQKISSYPYKK